MELTLAKLSVAILLARMRDAEVSLDKFLCAQKHQFFFDKFIFSVLSLP